MELEIVNSRGRGITTTIKVADITAYRSSHIQMSAELKAGNKTSEAI